MLLDDILQTVCLVLVEVYEGLVSYAEVLAVVLLVFLEIACEDL